MTPSHRRGRTPSLDLDAGNGLINRRALLGQGIAVAGAVYAPAVSRLFFGDAAGGAFELAHDADADQSQLIPAALLEFFAHEVSHLPPR